MIETLKLINYRNSAQCETIGMSCIDSFPATTYTFQSGKVYRLTSDFGCGSWGMVTCIGGRGDVEYSGKIMLDDAEADARILKKHSGFIAESYFPDINTSDELCTTHECIYRALNISGLNYSTNEIKSIFHLTDNRFDRPLNQISGEIWLASAAIWFSLDKDIFCFPWLNMRNYFRFETMKEFGIIDFLKKRKKLVLVPTSRKTFFEKSTKGVTIKQL